MAVEEEEELGYTTIVPPPPLPRPNEPATKRIWRRLGSEMVEEEEEEEEGRSKMEVRSLFLLPHPHSSVPLLHLPIFPHHLSLFLNAFLSPLHPLSISPLSLSSLLIIVHIMQGVTLSPPSLLRPVLLKRRRKCS